MRFSEFYGIPDGPNQEWFDPLLAVDTPLFVDPFMVWSEKSDLWIGSSDDQVSFFENAYALAAKGDAGFAPATIKVIDALKFPEVPELCLGYTVRGTRGSGSGLGYANKLRRAMVGAIHAGLDNLAHFEKVSLFGAGIGPDRVSDMTLCLLRPRFIAFTQSVCDQHGIPKRRFAFERLSYDLADSRWTSGYADLPENPRVPGKAVLLTPKRFLRVLPTINQHSYQWFVGTYSPEVLRADVSSFLNSRIDSKKIVEYAHAHPRSVQEFIEWAEKEGSAPYDDVFDHVGVVQPYNQARSAVAGTLSKRHIRNNDELVEALRELLAFFKHFMEEKGGWRLLFDDHLKPRHEVASQLAFLAVALSYCEINDVDLTREAEVGRGPVDFKASIGARIRALIEVKKANNGKYWSGIEAQLPTYLNSERVDVGFFLTVVLADEDCERIEGIEATVSKVSKLTGRELESIVIDARPRISASKL